MQPTGRGRGGWSETLCFYLLVQKRGEDGERVGGRKVEGRLLFLGEDQLGGEGR